VWFFPISMISVGLRKRSIVPVLINILTCSFNANLHPFKFFTEAARFPKCMLFIARSIIMITVLLFFMDRIFYLYAYLHY
jgi:hypothetical protein